MTEQTQPTDAEISACILAAKVKCMHPEAVTTIEIARAVLAKWGTPAGAGQPLTDSYVQMVPDKCDRIVWRNHYYHLPPAPQHTQAQAGAVPLTVRLTSFPESNGKRNWTALLVRKEKWDGLIGNCGGISLARGELWNRVAYEAECARFLIGERDTEPFILDYGDDITTPDDWAGERGRKRHHKGAAHG